MFFSNDVPFAKTISWVAIRAVLGMFGMIGMHGMFGAVPGVQSGVPGELAWVLGVPCGVSSLPLANDVVFGVPDLCLTCLIGCMSLPALCPPCLLVNAPAAIRCERRLSSSPLGEATVNP